MLEPPLLETATSHGQPHEIIYDGWIAGLSPIR
jgi:hypothetical protein